jgi:DNA primase
LSQTDEIKARVDIVDLIGEGVQLRKAGRSFKGLCPFHSERTPSFNVDPERQSWRCFGACGEGGDIFSYIMKQQNLGFRDALTQLAERAGVQLTPLDRHAEEREQHETRLRSANEAAATFYRAQLLNSAEAEHARAYVAQRDLSDEVGEAFGLGYAPDEREALQGHLSARGFTPAEMIEAGLVVDGERDNIDRFRGRLMFPIRDRRGRCIGFGGRALGDDAGPKYLNTSQTPVFDKSSTLYAFDRAREAARSADQIVIVEGYMDVLAAHQFDQRNVVAAMGTSLTERQVSLIKPVTRNIVLALDADSAGIAATLRGIDTTRDAVGTEQKPVLDARGILRFQDDLAADIHILALPPGSDPDDLIRKEPDRWSTLLREAPGYLDYRFTQIRESHDLNDARARAAAVDELLPVVAVIAEPVVRSEYVARLAAVARVETKAIEAMLRRRTSAPTPGPRLTRGDAPVRPTAPTHHDRPAEFLAKLIIARPEIVADLPNDLPLHTDDAALRELFAACISLGDGWRGSLDDTLAEYVDALESEAHDLQPYSVEDAHKATQSSTERLRHRFIQAELRAGSQGIAEGERTYGVATLVNGLTAEADAETIEDDDLRATARQVLENQAKSRSLHARRRSETARTPAAAVQPAPEPISEGES